MIIKLPLPPKDKKGRSILSPNTPSHWAAKARAKKIYREQANIAVLLMLDGNYPPLYEQGRLIFHWYHRTGHRMDVDNIMATMKSAIDGLVDGGIFTDDRYLTYGDPVQYTDKENPRIEVEITNYDWKTG